MSKKANFLEIKKYTRGISKKEVIFLCRACKKKESIYIDMYVINLHAFLVVLLKRFGSHSYSKSLSLHIQ